MPLAPTTHPCLHAGLVVQALVAAGIALAEVTTISKSLVVVDHKLLDILFAIQQLSNGPAISVSSLNPEGYFRASWCKSLQQRDRA